MPGRDDDGRGTGHRRGCLGLHRAHRDPRGDGALLPRVLDVGHRLEGPPRRAGRTEAGPPPDPLLHVRPAAAARPTPHQVRQGGRGRDGLVPPARRLLHLRGPGPHGPGVLHAPPAGRRARQLRRHRARTRDRRPCGTRSAGWARWPSSSWPASTRRRSTSPPTTTPPPKSRRSCRPGSPTSWSTGRRASPWGWPPTSRPTTWARSSTPPSTCSSTPTPRPTT